MKKYLVGLIAIVLATASVAFTRPTQASTFTNYYFPTDVAGNAQSYLKVGNMPYTSAQLGCTTGSKHCEVANDNFRSTSQGSGNYLIEPIGNNVSGTETFKN